MSTNGKKMPSAGCTPRARQHPLEPCVREGCRTKSSNNLIGISLLSLFLVLLFFFSMWAPQAQVAPEAKVAPQMPPLCLPLILTPRRLSGREPAEPPIPLPPCGHGRLAGGSRQQRQQLPHSASQSPRASVERSSREERAARVGILRELHVRPGVGGRVIPLCQEGVRLRAQGRGSVRVSACGRGSQGWV